MERSLANRAQHVNVGRTRPCARPLSTRPQGTGLQRSSLKVVCKVASQHSHLGEAIADWQQFQQRPPREERHHHHQKHVYHNKHHANTMTTTLPKPQHALERIHQSFIPHLDGRTVDPTDVLMWLREYLLLEPNTRHSAVVTAEETGESLLDLVSVLVLLDEDLKSEEQGATLVFQPVLDIRNKTTLHPPGFRDPTPQPSPDPSDPTSAAEPPALVAALISQARCPKLVSEYPAVCIAATVRMDSADVAIIVAESVEEHSSTRLRVANSAEGLVAAWRAVRRARAIVRGRSGGARDLFCTAQIESMPPDAQSGNGNGSGSSAQQGAMYLNVWRVR